MSDPVQPHRWQPTRFPRPWDSPGKNTGVGCHFLLQGMKVKSKSEATQSCDFMTPWTSWPHGLQPTRLPRPWDFPGKSTGVGCHHLLRFGQLALAKSSHYGRECTCQWGRDCEEGWRPLLASSVVMWIRHLRSRSPIPRITYEHLAHGFTDTSGRWNTIAMISNVSYLVNIPFKRQRNKKVIFFLMCVYFLFY